MKITKPVLAVLKNFAEVSEHFMFRPGGMQATVDKLKTVLVTAKLGETKHLATGFDPKFPHEAHIYDLNQFLAVLSMFPDADVEFGSRSLKIAAGRQEFELVYASPNILVTPPKLEIPIEEKHRFPINAQELATIRKAAAVLSSTHVSFIGNGKEAEIRTEVLEQKTKNTFRHSLGKCEDTFALYIEVNSMKLMSGRDYVAIVPSGSAAVRFETSDTGVPMVYTAGAHPDSEIAE